MEKRTSSIFSYIFIPLKLFTSRSWNHCQNPNKITINREGSTVSLNYAPENLRHIYLIGICGTGMASLAGMLKAKGYIVTGSDKNIYPPMSDLLHSLNIPILEGYLPEHLHPEPDLVIVGNVVSRDNPQAMELGRLRLPYLSFPQAIGHFALKDKRVHRDQRNTRKNNHFLHVGMGTGNGRHGPGIHDRRCSAQF